MLEGGFRKKLDHVKSTTDIQCHPTYVLIRTPRGAFGSLFYLSYLTNTSDKILKGHLRLIAWNLFDRRLLYITTD